MWSHEDVAGTPGSSLTEVLSLCFSLLDACLLWIGFLYSQLHRSYLIQKKACSRCTPQPGLLKRGCEVGGSWSHGVRFPSQQCSEPLKGAVSCTASNCSLSSNPAQYQALLFIVMMLVVFIGILTTKVIYLIIKSVEKNIYIPTTQGNNTEPFNMLPAFSIHIYLFILLSPFSLIYNMSISPDQLIVLCSVTLMKHTILSSRCAVIYLTRVLLSKC